MCKGFLKIPRSVFSSAMWNEKRVFSRYEALTDLYQSADFNTRMLTVSLRSLADRWRWEYKKVMRFMAMLEEEGYVRTSKDKSGTTVEIIDPDADGTQNGTRSGTPNGTPKPPSTKGLRGVGGTPDGTPSGTPDGTLSRAYKNDNYISCLNEELKENLNTPLIDPPKGSPPKSRFVKPTVEEVRRYCSDKGYHIDALQFWNFYESKGWKVGSSPMKSWTAACATWERRNNDRYSTDRTTGKEGGGHPSDNELVSAAVDLVSELAAKRKNGG